MWPLKRKFFFGGGEGRRGGGVRGEAFISKESKDVDV